MIGRGNAATPPGPRHGRSRPPPRKFKSVPEAISTGDGHGDGDGGTVFRVGPIIGTGSFGEIYHGTDAQGNKIYTLYAHASSLAATAGQTVTQGQTIAYVGSTGDSTGNHLHFEVYVNNTRVDPENWL